MLVTLRWKLRGSSVVAHDLVDAPQLRDGGRPRTIRPFDRTLTDAEANVLRDRVYDAIHEGSAGQWAGR